MAGKRGRRGWGAIKKLPSGRWHASYIGPDLARHNAPHTYETKMDAEGWLFTEHKLIVSDEWSSPESRNPWKKKRKSQGQLGPKDRSL